MTDRHTKRRRHPKRKNHPGGRRAKRLRAARRQIEINAEARAYLALRAEQ